MNTLTNCTSEQVSVNPTRLVHYVDRSQSTLAALCGAAVQGVRCPGPAACVVCVELAGGRPA